MSRFALLAACLALSVSACAPSGGASRLTASFRNLAPVPEKYGAYALWARTADADLPAGRFNVDAQGRVVYLDPEREAFVVKAPRSAIEALYVTQEPPGAAGDTPGKQIFLRGEAKGDAGEVALAPPIRAEDFASAGGEYLLDNPVTYKDPDDFNGLWFAVIVSKRYEPGLRLPPAPPGWLYAGWVIREGVPLRVGKFRAPDENDDWAGYSGRSGATELINPAGQPMPGEDFITHLPPGVPSGKNQPALAGSEVVVSLENAALANEDVCPSPLRLLVAKVPAAPVHKQAYPLRNVVSQLPGATLRFE